MKNLYFKDIEAFYADDESRMRSPELDFGVWWTDDGQHGWRRYRVSYVDATGELYAIRVTGVVNGVELLATFPLEPCEDCDGTGWESGRHDEGGSSRLCAGCGSTGKSRAAVDAALDGWAEVCGQPNSLAWIRGRLAETGVTA